LFFQPEQYFSLTTNQPTMFFSRLISPAERGLYNIVRSKQTKVADVLSTVSLNVSFSRALVGEKLNG
jgi:hypothetical protein